MKNIKIGITSGDLNGIGMEVILRTLNDKRLLNLCTPVIYASSKSVAFQKNVSELKDFSFNNAKNIQSVKNKQVNVINCWMDVVKVEYGQSSAEGGKYATFSLEQAVHDIKSGELDILVTAPINKKSMHLSGFEYPGHTEYLTSKFSCKQSLMLMVNDDLRVGLVTNHLPIKEIPNAINEKLILDKLRLFDQTLRMDFGIDRPAIAVLGLNPHAGDQGVLGSEEDQIIKPTIEKAKKEGILAIGPYAADGFFGSDNFKNFDGILAMYHDQGLTPFKALSFGNGVNFTAGLPFIRTSPDHGTAFEIAGKNEADIESFRSALYLAIDAMNNRIDFNENNENPLKKIDVKDFERRYNKNNEPNIMEINKGEEEDIIEEESEEDFQ